MDLTDWKGKSQSSFLPERPRKGLVFYSFWIGMVENALTGLPGRDLGD